MSGIVNTYNHDITETNANLNVLKKSGASYQNILNMIHEYRDKLTESIAEIRIKKENFSSFKDEKMRKMEKVQQIVKEKDDKIKKLKESVDQYTNISKKVIADMKFKNLKKVGKDPSVVKLWQFFYSVLYKEPESTFDYDEFVKVALTKRVDDFQSRVANFQIANLDRTQREQIKELKNSNFPQEQHDFNYFLEWIDYNYESYLCLK